MTKYPQLGLFKYILHLRINKIQKYNFLTSFFNSNAPISIGNKLDSKVPILEFEMQNPIFDP